MKIKKRSYKITFDLKEGYGKNGREHTIKEVTAIIEAWMKERLKKHLPVVTGILQEGTIFYPSKDGISKHDISTVHSAIFTGDLSGSVI